MFINLTIHAQSMLVEPPFWKPTTTTPIELKIQLATKKPKVIIMDVDSTIAKVVKRLEFVQEHIGDRNSHQNRFDNMFHDPRLYMLDELIYPAWQHLFQLRNEYRVIFVSGRRMWKESAFFFSNWLRRFMHYDQTWQTFFPRGFDVKFRPAGKEAKAWKLETISEIAHEWEIVAGYGNDTDIPIYEALGIEAILVDEDGNGWEYPTDFENPLSKDWQ